MSRLFQLLHVYLSVATDRKLARQLEFMTQENLILRDRLPKRIALTGRERRGSLRTVALGRAIRELIPTCRPEPLPAD